MQKMATGDGSSCTFDSSEAARKLIRSIVALPELAMRVAWFAERFEGKSDDAFAERLDCVASASQLPDEAAREAMLAIAVAFARRRDSAWLWALYQTAKRRSLINLERTLRPCTTTLPNSLESVDEQAPDFGMGRPLSVGERRTIARRPTRQQLEKLLFDPHPLVISQLLQAPGLTEDDVVVMATRRPAHVPTLERLIESPRWIVRRRVRLSIIFNPGTPHGLALPFVLTCPREDLRLIFETTTVSATLRAIARELYLRLPPILGEDRQTGLH